MAEDETDEPDEPPAEQESDEQDEAPTFTRRFIKGQGGREVLRKARECAEAGDVAAFREVLHKLELFEGMNGFDEGMAMFEQYRRALRSR
jgi:hypothetical protein